MVVATVIISALFNMNAQLIQEDPWIAIDVSRSEYNLEIPEHSARQILTARPVTAIRILRVTRLANVLQLEEHSSEWTVAIVQIALVVLNVRYHPAA